MVSADTSYNQHWITHNVRLPECAAGWAAKCDVGSLDIDGLNGRNTGAADHSTAVITADEVATITTQ
jgi:hypothetical protein